MIVPIRANQCVILPQLTFIIYYFILCRCEGAQPAANRAITVTLARLAAELQQPPVAVELAQAAIDAAADLLADQSAAGPSNSAQAGYASPAAMETDIPRLFPGQEDDQAASSNDATEDALRSSRILEEHSHSDTQRGVQSRMPDSARKMPHKGKTPRRTGGLKIYAPESVSFK